MGGCWLIDAGGEAGSDLPVGVSMAGTLSSLPRRRPVRSSVGGRVTRDDEAYDNGVSAYGVQQSKLIITPRNQYS